MAVYTAYVACDTVGSTTQLALPTDATFPEPDILYAYAPDYIMMLQAVPYQVTGNCTGIQWHDYATNALECTWEPNGNAYTIGTILKILTGDESGVPLPGSQGTSQQLNQYLFSMDDKFYGSNQGDMFCGWEGNDWFKLGKGKDTVYFADGQDKDTFKKFNWKKDTAVLDTDVANKLKDVSVKYKNKKTVLKFGDGDKVVMKGKKAPDSFSELKDCVDIQDWYV